MDQDGDRLTVDAAPLPQGALLSRGSYDPDSRGGSSPDGRKVRGTLHWVSARHGREAEIRLYDRLFREPNPASARTEGTFTDSLNPDSVVVPQCACSR